MKFILTLLALICFSVTASAQSTDPPVCGVNNNSTNIVPSGPNVTQINGTTNVSWHDFSTQTLAAGDYWTDLAYGCFAKMLTNSSALGVAQSHQYALTPAMDRSDCYVMAQNPDAGNSSQYVIGATTKDCVGGFGAWSQTVISSAQMPARTGHGEFVWDYFTGGKFWFPNGNTIRTCTITGIGTTSCTTAHTFSEYASGSVNFIDYAAMNQNGFIDVMGQATTGGVMDIFTYDTVHDVKSAVYTTACTGTLNTANQPGCIHKLAFAPSNGILVQFSSNGAGNEQGNHFWAYPTPANPMPLVENLTDHVDIAGRLSDGADTAFYEDFQDNPGPWPGCSFSFKPTSTLLPLSGNPLCVFEQGSYTAGWDVGARAWPIRAWVVYSMQDGSNNTTVSPATRCNADPSYADPTSGNWSASGTGRLENEILLVRVDAGGSFSKIWRLGLTHQRGICASNNFYSDPRASQSVDGKYIVFATNARWGNLCTGTPCTRGVGPGSQVDIVVMGGSVNGSGVLGPLFPSPPTSAPAVWTLAANKP